MKALSLEMWIIPLYGSLGDWATIPKKNTKLQSVNNMIPRFLPHIGLVQSERTFKKVILPDFEKSERGLSFSELFNFFHRW